MKLRRTRIDIGKWCDGLESPTRDEFFRWLSEKGIVDGWSVYLLLRDNEVIYVGMTSTVFRRLADHAGMARKGWSSQLKPFDNFSVIPVEDKISATSLEATIIHRLSPTLNHQCPICKVRVTMSLHADIVAGRSTPIRGYSMPLLSSARRAAPEVA